MSKSNELCSRISHCRKSGLGNQTYIVAVIEQLEIAFDFGLLGVLVQLMECQRVNSSLQPCFGQESPCRTDLFHNECAYVFQHIKHWLRNHFAWGVFSERGGNEI